MFVGHFGVGFGAKSIAWGHWLDPQRKEVGA
jgi:hypothetical protein